MTSSDSLFDNSITSTTEPLIDNTATSNSNTNTSTSNNLDHDENSKFSNSLITYRILVSRREAGAIIGKEGLNISKIRDTYNIKAGVSKVLDGCIDRILTVSGLVDNLPNALVEIAKSVRNANLETIKECELNDSNPLRLITYDYPPLKPLTQRPNYKSLEYSNSLFLRLIIPNSQVGILIGKGGSRIKQIQEDNNIKMVVSKDFLQNSNERLIEFQGNEANLSSALDEVSRYLLSDYQGTSSVNYYIPCTPIDNRFRNPRLNYNPLNSNANYNNNAINNNINNNQIGGKEIIKKISFPNDYIGALIGKRGSRIQEIRLASQCAVAIENSDDDENEDNNKEREITLVGTKYSVDKAIDMLNLYYEREQQRRAVANQ